MFHKVNQIRLFKRLNKTVCKKNPHILSSWKSAVVATEGNRERRAWSKCCETNNRSSFDKGGALFTS